MEKRKFTDCMVDFETLGLEPGCHVLQIGWAFFDRENPRRKMETMGLTFDKEEQETLGRSKLKSTVDWWKAQDRAIFKRVTSGGQSVEEALGFFNDDWSEFATDDTWLWSNGPAFDEPILNSLYTHTDLNPPFKFWNSRCMRTLLGMYPFTTRVKPAQAHDGESDAIAQAKTVQAVFKQLRSK